MTGQHAAGQPAQLPRGAGRQAAPAFAQPQQIACLLGTLARPCRPGTMCLASPDAPHHIRGNASAGAVLCRRHHLTQVFDDAEIETYFRRWLDAQSYLVRCSAADRYQLRARPLPPVPPQLPVPALPHAALLHRRSSVLLRLTTSRRFLQHDVAACLLLLVLLPLGLPAGMTCMRLTAAAACLLPALQLTIAMTRPRW